MLSTNLDTICMYVKSIHLHTGPKLTVVIISLTEKKFEFYATFLLDQYD